MTEQVLNQDQQDVADAFQDFLFSDDQFFVITGPAGTGKTFLCRHLITTVMPLYEQQCKMLGVPVEYDEVAFTATTNKAAEVLESSLGLPVSTVHSFLSLRVRNDFDLGKSFITRTRNWEPKPRHIVFIDECSMIDSNLFEEILDSFQDSKVVFVGDHAQLAPVGESISRVFTEVEERNYGRLETPVRNAGQPALQALCQQLRDTVETGVFRPMDEVPGVIDYLDDELMEEGLHHYFTDMEPNCRILCYTNTRVQDYNWEVRAEVRNQPEEFEVGDVLVTARTYVHKKQNLNVEREVEVVKIGDLQEDNRFTDLVPDGEPIDYREMEIRILSGSGDFMTVKVPCEPERVDHIIKRLAQKKRWPEHFGLKEGYADLREKAAGTVYKAQGSTYEAVFIDIGNMGTSRDAEQVARMLYVAVSRPTTRIFFYGTLPGKYVGVHHDRDTSSDRRAA